MCSTTCRQRNAFHHVDVSVSRAEAAGACSRVGSRAGKALQGAGWKALKEEGKRNNSLTE